MKFWKNGVIISVVILFIILISGCTDPGASAAYVLDGTWTLATSNPVGGDIGSGTFTQAYYGNFEFFGMTFDIYTGSGSLSGVRPRG